MSKNHTSSLHDIAWLYDDAHSTKYIHPHLNMSHPHPWHFEGINWTQDEHHQWNGPEHSNLSLWNTDSNVYSIYSEISSTNRLGTVNTIQFDFSQLKIQNDSGANRNVTNNKEILNDFQEISPYSIGGINNDESTNIVCTGEGFLCLRTDDNKSIPLRMLYSPDTSGTIVSPTSIVRQYSSTYMGWSIFTNCDSATGLLKLLYRNGMKSDDFSLIGSNDLWYHSQFVSSPSPTSSQPSSPKIHSLSNAAEY